jgi:hypothetical protein
MTSVLGGSSGRPGADVAQHEHAVDGLDEHLPSELRDPFLDEALQLLGQTPLLDYVRPNSNAAATSAFAALPR